MPAIQRTIVIRAEPGAVFDLISRVEDFSRYARMISSIKAIAPDTFRWNINIAGLDLEWRIKANQGVRVVEKNVSITKDQHLQIFSTTLTP